VLFVPTATGDSQERIDTFYRIYGDLDCEPYLRGKRQTPLVRPSPGVATANAPVLPLSRAS
jgi:hypothetical protein